MTLTHQRSRQDLDAVLDPVAGVQHDLSPFLRPSRISASSPFCRPIFTFCWCTTPSTTLKHGRLVADAKQRARRHLEHVAGFVDHDAGLDAEAVAQRCALLESGVDRDRRSHSRAALRRRSVEIFVKPDGSTTRTWPFERPAPPQCSSSTRSPGLIFTASRDSTSISTSRSAGSPSSTSGVPGVTTAALSWKHAQHAAVDRRIDRQIPAIAAVGTLQDASRCCRHSPAVASRGDWSGASSSTRGLERISAASACCSSNWAISSASFAERQFLAPLAIIEFGFVQLGFRNGVLRACAALASQLGLGKSLFMAGRFQHGSARRNAASAAFTRASAWPRSARRATPDRAARSSSAASCRRRPRRPGPC